MILARVQRSAPLLLAVLIAAACGTLLAPAERVHLTNDTTTPVAVHVNGGWAGTYEAGAVADVPIGGHGGPPFAIEARSPSGAVLFQLTIAATDVEAVRTGSGSMSVGSSLDCGWIEVSYGDAPPQPAAQPGGAPRPPAAGVCP